MEAELFFAEEDEEFEFIHSGESPEIDRFDFLIGKLEETVMSEEFFILRANFMDKYKSAPHSQLRMHELFQEYLSTIENFIEQALAEVTIPELRTIMQERHSEVDEDLLEMLTSFTDFEVFKEMMTACTLHNELAIAGASSVIHQDEMEDGELRPDLEGITGIRV